MGQRLDKWLVYARFAKHRSTAVQLIEEGLVRVNRERISKVSHAVKPDDVLTLVLGGKARVVKVLGEAERRSSASLAGQLYQEITPAEKPDASANLLC
jgi:ribosome-associated heat shock protein Hsp15